MHANPDQAQALANLHALCFDRPWPTADFIQHIDGDHTFTNADTTALLVIREGGGQAELLTLGTHPDARGEGAAKALLAEAVPHLTADVLFLEVAEDNAPAIALYRSLGFTPFGRRPNYYRRETGRITALLFELRLRPPPPWANLPA